MKKVFSDPYKSAEDEIYNVIKNFDQEGEFLGDGKRNIIKIFPLGEKELNIKSFKIPNAINKVAYRFIRKSKAERSFNYAHYLLEKDIGTPSPVAYAEEKEGFLFKRSFYISENLKSDLSFRTLVEEPNFPEFERILRSFTRFTFELHEKNVQFLDHSPGNTLIQINNGNYNFFLVDLNRMNFRKLSFEQRMKNFSRLTPKKEMLAIMANEYAKVSLEPEKKVFEKMWFYTNDFQEKFRRKKRFKRN